MCETYIDITHKSGYKSKKNGGGSMFFLEKIAGFVVVPSGFAFILFFFGFLFLFILRKKKMGTFFIVLSFFSYYTFSITPVSDFLLFPLESKYPPLTDFKAVRKVRTIVVLSSGVKDNPQLPVTSQISDTVFRVVEAMRVCKKLRNPRIIFSGGKVLGNIEGSKVMAHFVNIFGIPKSRVICETVSRNTYENAREVKKYLNDTPFILVTSAYHLPRAVSVFTKLGMNPIPAPADFKVQRKGRYTIVNYFPHINELQKSDLAIHEYVGRVWYFLKEM